MVTVGFLEGVGRRPSLVATSFRWVGRLHRNSRAKLFLIGLLRLLLVVGGLGAFTFAAWMTATALGLVVLGVSLISLEWWVKR